jgi:O-antigen/teichoic acid export membrane protein
MSEQVARALRRDAHTNEFILGAGIALVLRVVGVFVAFGLNIALARTLGADEAGVYFLAYSVFAIATVFGRFGLQKAIVRFVAANSMKQDWQKIAGVYKQSLVLTLLASLAILAAVLLLTPFLAHRLYEEPRLVQPLWIIALALVPYNLALVCSDALQGLKKISKTALINNVLLPLLQTLGVILLVQWPTAVGAALALIIASVLTLLIGLYFWFTTTPQLRGVVGAFDTRQLVQTAWPMLWTGLIQIIMVQSGTVLLGVWYDSQDVGIYNIATRVAAILTLVQAATNSIAAPKFAELYAAGDLHTLLQLTRKTVLASTFVATMLVLPMLLFPGFVLGLFGADYSAASTALIILAIGQWVNVASGPVGALFSMSGHERILRNDVFAATLLGVAVGLGLIPRYGVNGAALSSALTMTILNLLLLSQTRHYIFRNVDRK